MRNNGKEVSINSFIKDVTFKESDGTLGAFFVECVMSVDLITNCFDVIVSRAFDKSTPLYDTYNNPTESNLHKIREELKKQAYNECLDVLKDKIKNSP